MAHTKIYHRHRRYSSRSIVLLLMLLELHTITMLTIVESSSSSESEDAKSESLSISSDGGRSSSGEESLSKEVATPLLTFLLRPVNNNGPLEQSNSDNNAGIHKGRRGELGSIYPNENNEGDNNDSNVSSESDTSEVGEGLQFRFRRDGVQEAGPSHQIEEGGGSIVIPTNWGTYEEQAPVVVHSGSHSIENDATGVVATDDDDDDESGAFGDEYQSNESEDSNEYEAGESSISYDDYEGGRFEGRQFYPSQGDEDGDSREEHEPDGYYRQQYYATARPLNKQQTDVRKKEPQQQAGYRPGYRNRFGQQRPNYRQPQLPKDKIKEESTGSSLMSFFQKAKTFYDIFKAMNSAWKTVEDHYRKTGEGVFPKDLIHLNQSTRIAPNSENQSVNNTTKKMNLKRLRTTKVPIISPTKEEEDPEQYQDQQQHQQKQDTSQEREEYRSRRSWLNETVINNNNKESTFHLVSEQKEVENDDSQITESDLETDLSADSTSSSQNSASSSSSSTAVSEGRYIKGDPLKGYYDFVITEGSYKFWAVFQVGTALLIIYSTFAAIYYSKVNPLVSDYDYVDYLGGGRSLSDDSDFVDMDVPMVAPAAAAAVAAAVGAKAAASAATADGSEITLPEGSSRSRQQGESSAGWFGWLPHAGHTLRFILESIDKEYNEE